jgi:tetratricopeptide (TPR) repeat protein
LVDVIRRSPGSALDWSKLGFYLSPRYIRAAEEAYLHAIDLDSTQVLAILGLGDIYEKTYRIDLAKDLYKAVIDEGVDDARINERYARYDEVFRIALELNKSEDSTDPFLSRVYDKTLSPVWETFNSLLRKVQGRVYASFILVLAGSGVLLVREYMFYERFANGYEAIEERDFELAEEEYRRALRIRPNDQFTLNSLGHALFSQHRFVEAMHFFSRALEVDPEYGLAEDNLFITFSRLEGKLYTLNEDELNELESIVRQLLDSGHLAEDRRPWLLEFLAEYLEYQDRYEEAIEVLNQLSGFEDRISRLQEMVDENSDNSE